MRSHRWTLKAEQDGSRTLVTSWDGNTRDQRTYTRPRPLPSPISIIAAFSAVVDVDGVGRWWPLSSKRHRTGLPGHRGCLVPEDEPLGDNEIGDPAEPRDRLAGTNSSAIAYAAMIRASTVITHQRILRTTARVASSRLGQPLGVQPIVEVVDPVIARGSLLLEPEAMVTGAVDVDVRC